MATAVQGGSLASSQSPAGQPGTPSTHPCCCLPWCQRSWGQGQVGPVPGTALWTYGHSRDLGSQVQPFWGGPDLALASGCFSLMACARPNPSGALLAAGSGWQGCRENKALVSQASADGRVPC